MRNWVSQTVVLASASLLVVAAPLHAVAGAGRYTDPFKAYAAGDYDEASRLFLDAKTDRPKDPRVDFDLGNAFYRKGDYGAAAQAFARASTAKDPKLRAQASYNMGNALFQAQKLEEAAKAYEQTLALAPKDDDARHNLDVVKRVIEQKRQQRPSGEGSQKQDPQPQQKQPQPSQGAQQQKQQDRRQGEDRASQQKQGQEQGQGQGQKPEQEKGSTEASRKDGQQNKGGQQGQVDEGGARQGGASKSGDQKGMSREEAVRYLRQLGDQRPKLPRDTRGGSTVPPEKDW